MKHRLLGVAVVAAALAGLAPMAQAQPAMTCAPDFQVVCAVIGKACRTVNDASYGRIYCQLG